MMSNFIKNPIFEFYSKPHNFWAFLPQKNGDAIEKLPAKFGALILQDEGDIWRRRKWWIVFWEMRGIGWGMGKDEKENFEMDLVSTLHSSISYLSLKWTSTQTQWTQSIRNFDPNFLIISCPMTHLNWTQGPTIHYIQNDVHYRSKLNLNLASRIINQY